MPFEAVFLGKQVFQTNLISAFVNHYKKSQKENIVQQVDWSGLLCGNAEAQ